MVEDSETLYIRYRDTVQFYPLYQQHNKTGALAKASTQHRPVYRKLFYESDNTGLHVSILEKS